ncbi:hypothetical protein I9R53_00240, partial [Campylobacter jejuni]|nr:hypothetical protein [Campylobacter jejuni]
MKKLILTTGPSLGGKINLNQIHQDKFIYRINGAHGDIESIKNTIINLRKQKADIDILIDLPGNKIRTSGISEAIQVEKDKDFSLKIDQFNYKEFYKLVK